jgi:polysaccharide deacetylase family protein (PEP-CTERM system associated)
MVSQSSSSLESLNDTRQSGRDPYSNFTWLTVDVEEYYDAEIFSGIISRDDRTKFPPHVDKTTTDLLEIFADSNVRGTFFILGSIAEKNPGLVKAIMEGGHEIASHGFGHRMITRMSPAEFREDVRKSKRILENVSGGPVRGYRAPTFSIVEKTKWAHEILRDEGFQYSSSVFPIRHDRYGWPEFGIHPRKMAVNGNRWIWEFPLSVERIGSMNIPFGGGGYLRLYPLFLTKCLIRRVLRAGRNVIVYVHPWEIDRQHPRISMPMMKRIRHYTRISSMEGKMRELFRLFPFGKLGMLEL